MYAISRIHGQYDAYGCRVLKIEIPDKETGKDGTSLITKDMS
jgi:hypothetical protein